MYWMMANKVLSNTNDTASKSKSKLDFRFADEEDITDIVELVNQAYACETDPTSDRYFRNDGDKVSEEEVRHHNR